MAKNKTEEQQNLSFSDKVKELEKRFEKTNSQPIIIPTGSIAFDNALGGGYYGKRIIELISWEGCGKTTLALHAVAEAQKLGLNASYIDSEHALDRKYAEAIGVDWEKLALFQPGNGEEGFEYAKELLANNHLSLLVIDSTSGMLPKKQMEDPAGSSNLGLHARLMGQEIPKIVNLADAGNCAVIFISQFREKIGVMFGSPETTQGGNALKFWASVRVELRKTLDKTGDDVTGLHTRFKVVKNKIVAPYKTGEIPIIFGVGIDKMQEIVDIGKENNILKLRAGVITYNDSKYTESEFKLLINDNPEFYNEIKKELTSKLNGELIETIEI